MGEGRPGYEYGVNGVVVTDPANKVVFVGMIQRLAGPGGPNVQDASQRAVAGSSGWPGVR
jgi:hypothetical protein